MIQFGEKKVKGRKYTTAIVRGYYFICKDKQGDECRYWMGETFDEAFASFEEIGDKYLGEHNNYRYWIDFCYGYDVDRRLTWSNLDHSGRFLDYSLELC